MPSNPSERSFSSSSKDEDKDEDCECNPRVKKICGDDGVTYQNACIAKCIGVQVKNNGSCEKVSSSKPKVSKKTNSCGDCTRVIEPVCGKDNKTHLNRCFLKCKKVHLKYTGPC